MLHVEHIPVRLKEKKKSQEMFINYTITITLAPSCTFTRFFTREKGKQIVS